MHANIQPLARRIINDPTVPSGKRIQFIPQEIAKAELSLNGMAAGTLDGELIDFYDGKPNFVVPASMVVREEAVPIGGLPIR